MRHRGLMRLRGLKRPDATSQPERPGPWQQVLPAKLPTNLELLLSEAVVSDPQVAEAEMADEVVSA